MYQRKHGERRFVLFCLCVMFCAGILLFVFLNAHTAIQLLVNCKSHTLLYGITSEYDTQTCMWGLNEDWNDYYAMGILMMIKMNILWIVPWSFLVLFCMSCQVYFVLNFETFECDYIVYCLRKYRTSLYYMRVALVL